MKERKMNMGKRFGAWRALPAVACALAVLLAACGCGPDESSLAARYDGGQVTEDEVSAYTAQFREQRGFADDDAWAQYLVDEGLTTSTWRQRAIGVIVEERLIGDEAQRHGIQPDEARIAEQEAQDRQAAGIAEGDDAAWADYLASAGLTEEQYREDLEYASIESQLLAENVGLDAASDADVLTDYMRDRNSYLLSRIALRYRVLCYDTREAAQAVLDELAGLSGDELASRFDELLDQDDSADTTGENGGDIGWDIASDLGSVQQELNAEMPTAGVVSAQVHELDGKYYVMLPVDRYVFTSESSYDALPDDDLKAFVYQSATYSTWNQMVQDYIAGLREAAHVQYRDATRQLPYDVDDQIAALKEQVSR